MQQVEVQLEDDLTGGPADETVRFGLDGRMFEIDLNERHAADFRQRLAPFVERARPVRSRRSRTMARTAASRERSQEIRAWAEKHGFVVAQHGRLPRDVIEQYDSALSGEQPPELRGRQRSAGRRSAPHDASSKPHRSVRRSQKHRARRAG
jgi:Lsr2